MRMNEHNTALAGRLLRDILAFDSGDSTIDAVHSQVQSSVAVFDNDGSGVASLVRLAEADIEEIRFTMIDVEQREAVRVRLQELREELERLWPRPANE